MELPFTAEQFFGVFERYNTDLPFAGTVLAAVALIIVVLSFRGSAVAARTVYFLLAVLWAWSGIVYHEIYFTAINPAAYFFGAFVLLQAGLFTASGFSVREAVFRPSRSVRTTVAAALIIYALIAYPLIGYFLGHDFPRTPTFGLPCPLTIFTFGILVLAGNRAGWHLFVIPALWTIIGSSAAVLFGIWQDLALPAAAAAALAVRFFADGGD